MPGFLTKCFGGGTKQSEPIEPGVLAINAEVKRCSAEMERRSLEVFGDLGR